MHCSRKLALTSQNITAGSAFGAGIDCKSFIKILVKNRVYFAH